MLTFHLLPFVRQTSGGERALGRMSAAKPHSNGTSQSALRRPLPAGLADNVVRYSTILSGKTSGSRLNSYFATFFRVKLG